MKIIKLFQASENGAFIKIKNGPRSMISIGYATCPKLLTVLLLNYVIFIVKCKK